MTKIPEALIEQIPNWNFNMVYEHFDLLEPPKNIRDKVEEGIKIKFPIEIILNENYQEFPITKEVRILGFGLCDLIIFQREIRNRKKEMLAYIYENYDNDVTKSRIKEN